MEQSLVREDPQAMRDWLVARLAEHLRMSPDEIRPDMPLSEYGLDSLYALTVATEIEDHLGLTVDPTMMWDNPTVDALIEAITAELARAA
ncbi:acyl carrier protein [Streptomyces sp. MAD19A]|uniref:acyl carrier protein n=1 Tax=Streptomyces sp. MAD19A TaxID=3242896 RepID=UPI003527C225